MGRAVALAESTGGHRRLAWHAEIGPRLPGAAMRPVRTQLSSSSAVPSLRPLGELGFGRASAMVRGLKPCCLADGSCIHASLGIWERWATGPGGSLRLDSFLLAQGEHLASPLSMKRLCFQKTSMAFFSAGAFGWKIHKTRNFWANIMSTSADILARSCRECSNHASRERLLTV